MFINKYSEIKPAKENLREKFRNKYLDLAPIKKAIPNTGILFVFFHSLYSDQIEKFRNTIMYLQKYYTFIPYSECVEKIKTNTEINKRYACISSDDGFKNFNLAAELFDELGIKGMVFVNPSIVGETDYTKIKEHCRHRLKIEPHEFLNWEELSNLKRRGHEIGNHGYFHQNLSTLNRAELKIEILNSKVAIEKELGPISHYAYPYGQRKFINKLAIDTIIECDHDSIASAIRGSHTKGMLESKDLILRQQIEPWYPIKHVKYFIGQ